MATMNIMQFAHEVGRVDRLTLEASLPFHAAWKKADKEQRAALRLEWYIGYVEGNLRVSHERAERIVDAGKHENCTTQTLRALDRAKAKFSYHVIRPEGRNEKREGAKQGRRKATVDAAKTGTVSGDATVGGSGDVEAAPI